MDQELDASYRYRRLGRRAAWAGGILALCVAVLVLLPGWLRPSVAREQIRTGKVDRGPVEGIVEAPGTVIPAFEGVLSSPVEARVEKILKRPGEVVRAGEEILKLDTSASRLDLERIEDQLAKKVNEQEQLRLQPGEEPQRPARPDRDARSSTPRPREYRAEQNRKLRADGLVSEQTLQGVRGRGEEGADRARPARSSRSSDARRSTEAQLQGLELDLATSARSATRPAASSSSPPPARTAPASSPGSCPRRARRCQRGEVHRPHRRPRLLPRRGHGLGRPRLAASAPGCRCACCSTASRSRDGSPQIDPDDRERRRQVHRGARRRRAIPSCATTCASTCWW